MLFFYGPKLLGSESRAMIGSLGVDRVAVGLTLQTVESYRLGDDVLVSAYVKKNGREHANSGVSS